MDRMTNAMVVGGASEMVSWFQQVSILNCDEQNVIANPELSA